MYYRTIRECKLIFLNSDFPYFKTFFPDLNVCPNETHVRLEGQTPDRFRGFPPGQQAENSTDRTHTVKISHLLPLRRLLTFATRSTDFQPKQYTPATQTSHTLQIEGARTC